MHFPKEAVKSVKGLFKFRLYRLRVNQMLQQSHIYIIMSCFLSAVYENQHNTINFSIALYTIEIVSKQLHIIKRGSESVIWESVMPNSKYKPSQTRL